MSSKELFYNGIRATYEMGNKSYTITTDIGSGAKMSKTDSLPKNIIFGFQAKNFVKQKMIEAAEKKQIKNIGIPSEKVYEY